VLAVALLFAGRALTSTDQQPASARADDDPAAELAAAVAEAPQFGVPRPGDPEYADYQEMLAHPRYRSSLENTEGYALPYDPEWRAVVNGRREVEPDPSLAFHHGFVSLDALGESYLDGMAAEDANMLFDLAVTPEEFKTIFWPEFPQSRPYVRIPEQEAWMFHLTHMNDELGQLYGRFSGVEREFVGVQVGEVKEYTNFRILEDVVITAREVDTGRTVTLTVESVAEVQGRYKVFSYGRA
jgi:hypothetical protein